MGMAFRQYILFYQISESACSPTYLSKSDFFRFTTNAEKMKQRNLTNTFLFISVKNFTSRIKIRIFRKTTQRQKITSGPVLLLLSL